VLGNGPMDTHSDTWHVFSIGSDPRLYNESGSVARGLQNWNWELRSCKSQENGNTMAYNRVQQRV
jgi:hypothetical protein